MGGVGQKAEQGVEAAVARGGEGGERLAAAVHGLYENEIYAQLGEELHLAAVLGQAVGLRWHSVRTVAVFQRRDAAGDQARVALIILAACGTTKVDPMVVLRNE